MNKIFLIGNLGRDPEMTYTNQGVAVTKFSLAVRRFGKSPTGEKQDLTDWFNVTAWRQQAETCGQLLRKGTKLYVEGRLQPRQYTASDGSTRTSMDVVLTDFEILTPKSQSDDNDELGDVSDHSF